MIDNAQSTRRDAFVLAGLTAAALLFFGLLAPYGLNIGEEGATVYLIARTAGGQRPYIDFISGYGPAYFYWHAALLRLFGSNLLVLRCFLVLVNSAAVLLLYVVARRLLPRRWALLAALAYPALVPIVPAVSYPFNIPYPAWYAVTLWLLGLHLVQRWCADGRLRWLFLCGVLAGLSFSFKPNSGLFNLAAAALAVACVAAAPGIADRRPWQSAVWAAVLVSALAGVALVLRIHLVGREGPIFALPVFGVVAASLAGRRRADNKSTSPAASLLALLLGFAATLPWMAWYLAQLGWAGFAHDVLFLNTGYEQFFYLAYRALGIRDLALVAVAAASLGLAAACARGWIGGRLVGVALLPVTVGVAAWLLFFAPMPEGFQKAVLQRVQDASFGAVLVIHVALIAVLSRRARLTRRDVQREVQLVVLGLAAVCCYLDAYPRSDFFHLSYSAPLTWVIGVWLMWRVVRRWQKALPQLSNGIDRGARVALMAALVVVATPQLKVAGQVAWHTIRPADSSLMRLALRRAPLLVRRDVAASVRDLVPLVSYLETVPTRSRALFTFPNLDLISFLCGRDTPARIGYFNPGWPDHLVEAEVVDALEDRPPEVAVVADPASLFFADAPAYYVLLRDLIERRYVPFGRVGGYTLLRHAGFIAPPFTPPAQAPASSCDAPQLVDDPLALAACLRNPPGGARPLLVRVRDSESAAAAAVVAQWWGDAKSAAESRNPTLSLLALRVVGELGDRRAAGALLSAPEPSTRPERDAWSTALFYIAVRGLIDPFQFGHGAADLTMQPVFDDPRFSHWLAQGSDVRLRFFAAWAFGELLQRDAGRRDELLALLHETFEGDDVALILASGAALARVDADPGIAQSLLQRLDVGQGLLPGILFDWARLHPGTAPSFLAADLGDAPEPKRELVVLLAGTLRQPELRALLRGLLSSPAPRLRAAAVWSLGQSGNTAVLPWVHAAEADADARVRRFAGAARRQLEHDVSQASSNAASRPSIADMGR
jgi:hypothetical protein